MHAFQAETARRDVFRAETDSPILNFESKPVSMLGYSGPDLLTLAVAMRISQTLLDNAKGGMFQRRLVEQQSALSQ